MGSASLTIRPAMPDEAARLAELGARSYRAAWGAMTDPEDLESYVGETFRPERIEAALWEPGATTLVAVEGDAILGYAKVNLAVPPPAVAAERPLHLHRLYLEPGRTGHGLGSALMDAVLELAVRNGHDVLWLTVWEKNERGIVFYRRWRFEVVGREDFRLGSDLQNDLIMVRRVGGGG